MYIIHTIHILHILHTTHMHIYYHNAPKYSNIHIPQHYYYIHTVTYTHITPLPTDILINPLHSSFPYPNFILNSSAANSLILLLQLTKNVNILSIGAHSVCVNNTKPMNIGMVLVVLVVVVSVDAKPNEVYMDEVCIT